MLQSMGSQRIRHDLGTENSRSVLSDSFAEGWTTADLRPWDLPARTLEGVAISFSRGSPQPRDQTHVFCIGRGVLYC